MNNLQAFAAAQAAKAIIARGVEEGLRNSQSPDYYDTRMIWDTPYSFRKRETRGLIWGITLACACLTAGMGGWGVVSFLMGAGSVLGFLVAWDNGKKLREEMPKAPAAMDVPSRARVRVEPPMKRKE